jgi:DNA-binding Lrp family transcriptional regulator
VITAVVLINAANDRIPEVAQALVELDGVREVYSVAGRVDLVAIVRVAEHEHLADVIAGRIDKVGGVENTESLIAFRAYSEQQLDAAFSLGAGAAEPR